MPAGLTTDDHRRIRELTTSVEERTGAQIATVIVRQSGRYVAYTVAWAALGAIFISVLLTVAGPAMGARSVIFYELLILAGLLSALEVSPVRFAIVSRRVKNGNARNLAHREFAAHSMGEEASQRRILLFVSMGERYVEIVTDRSTHASVPEGTWTRIVDDLVAAVKSGNIGDGIIAAIKACDATLSPRQVHS